jgi:hypothetical protein
MKSSNTNAAKVLDFAGSDKNLGLRIAGLLTVFGLMVLFAWTLVELSGLMAVRTGIREGYWAVLVLLVGVLAMKTKEHVFGMLLSMVGTLLSVVYSVNALDLLWAERPPLFWLVAVAWAVRVVLWAGKLVESRN